MTTATLPDKARQQTVFFSGLNFGPQPKKGHWYAKSDGVQAYRLEHVPIFRSGEFMDSFGEQHLWEDLHMQMLASNFSLLRDNGSFPDPPIRCDHPSLFGGGRLESVIGYVDTLVAERATSPVDGTEYTYIFADYDILDLEAGKKVASGLWRHRSAEVGWYETNAKAEFWPVLVGFAYVDIPAVEGLTGDFRKFAKTLPGVGTQFAAVAADNQEEPTVAQDTTTSDPGGQGGQVPPTSPPSPEPPDTPTQEPVPPPQAHGHTLNAHTFTVGGAPVTDFAAVQAHIDGLEQFQDETITAGRISFVEGLFSGNQIVANQLDPFKELVKDMSGEMFEKFKASFAGAPELTVLGQHAVTPAAGGTPEGSGGHEDPEIDQARRNYSRHISAGLPQAQLEQTASYKLLKSKELI